MLVHLAGAHAAPPSAQHPLLERGFARRAFDAFCSFPNGQPRGCVFPRGGLHQQATRRLRMTDRIEKTIELKAPVSRVWRALTDHREFGTWFRVRLDGPFVPGQVSRGHITYPGYEHVKWEATVQRMEPERLFSFTWHPYAIDTAVDY